MDKATSDISVEMQERKLFSEKWNEEKLTGKVTFLLSIMYVVVTYGFILTLPSANLALYSLVYPLLFAWRIYSYTKNKSFLFLFDNCYFVNTALIIFIWFDLPMNTYFFSIFATVNGPVLWAVLPFRNTLAFHDIDKITSCYIHWAPTLVTWVIRWFPAKTSFVWVRTFALEDVNITPIYLWHEGSNYFWFIVVPMAFLVTHDLIYSFVVHVIIKPNEEYSDSFTYQKSKENMLSNCMQRLPQGLHLIFYLLLSFIMYILGILFSILCYRMFLIHTVILVLQLAVMIWNGGCYYLDYFAYLALKAADSIEERTLKKPLSIVKI